MNSSEKKIITFTVFFLVFLNIFIQISLFKNFLDNQIINSFSPGSTDTLDYVERASIIFKEGSFYKAFGDGYRLPGYPLFLSIFYHFSEKPLLAARYAQIFLSSLTIFFGYLSFYEILKSRILSLLGCIFIFIWLPFYYFSPILYAESCSLFLIALFIFLLAKVHQGKFYIILLSINIALITSFKPNNILMFIPFCAFVLATPQNGVKPQNQGKFNKISSIGASLFLLVSMMAPWVIFASVNNHAFIPLSTTSGINFLEGTAQVNELVGKEIRAKVNKLELSKLEKDKYYRKLAFNNWLVSPWENFIHGFKKIFHVFGFSLRGITDLIISLQLIASVTMSILLWRLKKYKNWTIFFWTLLIITSIQSFVFVGNQRFKTVIFDLPALIIIYLGIVVVWDNFLKPRFRRQKSDSVFDLLR